MEANVNLKDSDGWTALMYAAMGGYMSSCKLLLNAGADPQVKNNDGDTAAVIAENNHNTQCSALIAAQLTENMHKQ